ncbi:uncharacterized protein NMK_2486 [Novimethylophilus kurashikiensis]|uniref:ParB/Sulfiredoxin domain-containing protein n=1 Tax=Novimethylophilus kurashikiensis TaxID=1825523 RepID=A0A2R5FA21_9PROT|nr:hypothetical protein [Novimethylophilus kurashikiensis]GBG14885.1 uncharacterized protein NMK_2486 [Novimethylophilus kurashikiensis]
MSKAVSPEIHWLTEPEEHDYPAAASYLALIYDETHVVRHSTLLRTAPVTAFKAKDIFRASGLSLLGVSNSHVSKNIKKIAAGTPLSPILLVRDRSLGKVVIADGYHRICAVYKVDEDAMVPCKIV